MYTWRATWIPGQRKVKSMPFSHDGPLPLVLPAAGPPLRKLLCTLWIALSLCHSIPSHLGPSHPKLHRLVVLSLHLCLWSCFDFFWKHGITNSSCLSCDSLKPTTVHGVWTRSISNIHSVCGSPCDGCIFGTYKQEKAGPILEFRVRWRLAFRDYLGRLVELLPSHFTQFGQQE